jgi:hypothetical protein
MPWPIKQRSQSVLGLCLTEDRLHAVVVHRRKDAPVAGPSASTALTLPMEGLDPERVGETLREFLKSAGLRERTCVVALPAGWVMSQTVLLPAGITPADRDSFLEIEAEKGFPCDLGELQMARSVFGAGAAEHVTQLAVRRVRLAQLGAVLAAADLSPVSITVGVLSPVGQVAPVRTGRITVTTETTGAVVTITAGGGLVAFRSLVAGPADALARELRITVEQIPSELRAELKELALLGDESLVAALKGAMAGWAKNMDFTLLPPAAKDVAVADQLALAIATRWLETGSSALEFLPPRPSRWSVWLSRYSSKRVGVGVLVAAACLVLLIGLFGWQEYRRASLRARWQAMATQVTALQGVQTNIRNFRPWYDATYRDLRIFRTVTESFPDNGSVTAKSVEIRAPATVAISGTATDNTALLRTLDLLRKAKEVRALKVEQILGKTPLQFTVNFRWEENATP